MKVHNNGKITHAERSSRLPQQKAENFGNSSAQWKNRSPHIVNSILFFAWAVILWAIFAVPIFSGDVLFAENLNVYSLLQNELFTELLPLVGALITLAATSFLYAIVCCLIQLKGDNLAKWIVNISCSALYGANIVCSIIFAVKIKTIVGDLKGVYGCFSSVNIAATFLFAAIGMVFLFMQELRNFFRELWKAISYPYTVYARSWGGFVFGAVGATINIAALIFTSYFLGAYGADDMSIFLLVITIFSVALSILATFFSLARAGGAAIFSFVTCLANAVAVIAKCVQERFVTAWITPTILSAVAALIFLIALLLQIGGYENKK